MKQLKTELMVLCDYASIAKDGKLSINGIFDEVRVTALPGGLARAFAVATVSGTPDTSYTLTFKLEQKNKATLPPHNIEVRTGTNGRNNIVVEFLGMSFPKEGDYEIKMYHGNDEIGSTMLKVIHMSQEPTFKLPN